MEANKREEKKTLKLRYKEMREKKKETF